MASYKLAWKDRWVRGTSPITGDTDCSIPIVYLEQDAPNRITYEWTGAQFTRLFSALKTGADLMFPEVANDILWDLLKGVHCPPELQEDESGCVEYPNAAPFIKYFPDNPFITGDVQAGWITEAWVRFGEFDSIFPDWIDEWITGVIEDFTGYESTDILCNIASLPLNSIESWLENGGVLPKIEVHFAGTGTVELTLLSFPLGGRAIIELDQEPNILDFLTGGILDPAAFTVELDRDLVSFPPEEYPINNVEIPVTTAGNHVLYIVFVPVVNDTLIPIGMGGGLRSVELCGFEDVPMAGIQNVIFEDCTLKIVVDGVPEEVQNFQDLYACVEALMATQAEITQAIIDAEEIKSARFLSGYGGNLESGIVINPDGTVEPSAGSDVDDPETPLDEASMAFYGGSQGVVRGLEIFYDRLDSCYGATNGTPVNPASYAKFQIKLYFPCDDVNMDIAIDDYYAYRATANMHAFNPVAATYQYMYCHGADEAAWGQWLSDNPMGFPVAKVAQMHMLSTALSEEFWTKYFDIGAKVPSTDYQQAPCTPIDTEEFDFNMALADIPSYPLPRAWKASHRMLIEVSGTFTDADTPNVIKDAFWSLNTVTGVKTFETLSITVGGISNPTAAEIPYQASHVYSLTRDKNAGEDGGSISKNNQEFALTGSPVVGVLHIKITDLGEYTVT